MINSSQKRIRLSTASAHCHGLVALGGIACLFSLSVPSSPCSWSCCLPHEEAAASALGRRQQTPGLVLRTVLGIDERLNAPSPSWFTSHGRVEGWGLCSHELWLLHRLLVCGWIPWGVAGNVGPGGSHWSLDAGRWTPDRCHRGRPARKSAASGQSIGVNCATTLLHQLLEFGSFVLKPNFHLEKQRKSFRKLKEDLQSKLKDSLKITHTDQLMSREMLYINILHSLTLLVFQDINNMHTDKMNNWFGIWLWTDSCVLPEYFLSTCQRKELHCW